MEMTIRRLLIFLLLLLLRKTVHLREGKKTTWVGRNRALGTGRSRLLYPRDKSFLTRTLHDFGRSSHLIRSECIHNLLLAAAAHRSFPTYINIHFGDEHVPIIIKMKKKKRIISAMLALC